MNLLSKHTEFTFIVDTSLYSLSPLSPRCYSQSPDNQIVLQGGNGDKGLKNYVGEKTGDFR